MTYSVLVIGCNGPGCNVVYRVCCASDHPTMTVNWQRADIEILPPELSEEDFHGDPEVSFRLLDTRRNEVVLILKGYSTSFWSQPWAEAWARPLSGSYPNVSELTVPGS